MILSRSAEMQNLDFLKYLHFIHLPSSLPPRIYFEFSRVKLSDSQFEPLLTDTSCASCRMIEVPFAKPLVFQ